MVKSINIETQIRSLTKVLEDLRQGVIQVPPFQRDFVWERNNIRELFDSIKNNYPIGSILLWKPRERKDWKSRKIGSYVLPECDGQQIYVLDGYQRMSSLFGCLTNPEKAGLMYDEKLRGDFFSLYYDLEDESFVYLGGRDVKPSQVPVYILMSTMDFRRHSRKYIEPYVKEEKLEQYLDRADAFSRSLIDYKLAVIEVTNAELDDAVDIFSRINSKGTEISPDWMVSALAYNDHFNFALEIDNLKDRLRRYNFSGISRTALFRCYQSAFDNKMYIDQQNFEKLAKRRDFAETVKETTPYIEKAVKFLYQELNVIDYKLLPYNTQLIFLMTFFKKVTAPTAAQMKALKKWFWVTSYSNYFTIYSLSNQRKAFEHFVEFIRGFENDMVFMDSSKQAFSTLSFPDRISLASVRCRSLLLFELYYYRNIMNTMPQRRGLNLKKLTVTVEATPENIVPYTGTERRLRWPLLDSLEILGENDIIYDAYMLPRNSSNMKEMLEKRRKILIEKEKNFVGNLGLEYRE